MLALTKIRLECGYSLQGLSSATGIHPDTLRWHETSYRKNRNSKGRIRPNNAKIIADVLGVGVLDLCNIQKTYIVLKEVE